MAFCPKCSKDIDPTATVCPHCGYDWPAKDDSKWRTGWEYSGLAEVALTVGALAAGFGCLAILYFALLSILTENWFNAFVFSPIAFLCQFALVVVFIRESNRSD